MAKTFTKIRRWAEEKGFKVEDEAGYGDLPCMKIYAKVGDKETIFKVEMRESTIYHSIKGMKGDPKGLYISQLGNKYRRGIYQGTQVSAIRELEGFLKN